MRATAQQMKTKTNMKHNINANYYRMIVQQQGQVAGGRQGRPGGGGWQA